MSVWLVLGALLAVACVLVVALPFLRRPGLAAAQDRLDEPDELEQRRVELVERRDRALAALKELEFDHRTGKVSDEDYRALVGPLRRQAAETLRALEPRASDGSAGGGAVYGGAYRGPGPPTIQGVVMTNRNGLEPTAVVEPPQVPEPSPVPSEPPQPVTVPEPSPVPSEPPMPAPIPDPTPEPSPPLPEPPAPTG
jgi:hypothetical protein